MEKIPTIAPEDSRLPDRENGENGKGAASSTPKMTRRKLLEAVVATAAVAMLPGGTKKSVEAMNNSETLIPETIGDIETFGADSPLSLSEISDLYDQENAKFTNSAETLDSHTIYISAFVKKSEYDNIANNSDLYFEGEENLYQTFIQRHIDEALSMYRAVDTNRFSELANLNFEIRRVVVVDDSVDRLDLPRSNDVREGQWLDNSFNDTDATISSNIAEGYNPTTTSAWNYAKKIDYGFIHESMHMWGIPDVYALDAYFDSFPSSSRIGAILDQIKIAEEQGDVDLVRHLLTVLEMLRGKLESEQVDFSAERKFLEFLEFSKEDADLLLAEYEENKHDVNYMSLLSTKYPDKKLYIETLLNGGDIAQNNPWLRYRMKDRNDDSYKNGIMSGGMARSGNKVCDFHAWLLNNRIKYGNFHDSKTIAVESGWNFRAPRQYDNPPNMFILKINDATLDYGDSAPVTHVDLAGASIEIFTSFPGGIYGDREEFLNDPILVGALDEDGRIGIKDLFNIVNVYPETEQNVSDVVMLQDKSAIFLVRVRPADDQSNQRLRIGYLVVSDFLLADVTDDKEFAVQMEFNILTTWNAPSQKSTEIVYTKIDPSNFTFLPVIQS